MRDTDTEGGGTVERVAQWMVEGRLGYWTAIAVRNWIEIGWGESVADDYWERYMDAVAMR